MIKNFYLFSILLLINLTTNFFSKVILETDELLITSLHEQFTNEQINEVLGFKEKWEWLNYILFPLIMLLKISITAAVIDFGLFFFNKQLKYKKIFNIVAKAEFIFLLVIIVKTAWFYYFKTDYNLEDLQYFYPLSALNIIGYEGLQSWFIYPFQVLNLFEIVYWFILANLIGKELHVNTDKGFSIVASSYGVSLLIWVIGVMFITLNMN